MRSNKGQALIEFILILPFIIMLILAFMDIAHVVLTKFELQRELDIVETYYKDGNRDEYKGDYEVEYIQEGKYTTIVIKEEIKTNTPLLDKIIDESIEEKVVIISE